jgi:hypothetical protein
MLHILKANQSVRDVRSAQRLLLDLKDRVRRDKTVPDYNRASGFMKLEMAYQHLERRLPATPDAWWCSECDVAGCKHAAAHASRFRVQKVSAAL